MSSNSSTDKPTQGPQSEINSSQEQQSNSNGLWWLFRNLFLFTKETEKEIKKQAKVRVGNVITTENIIQGIKSGFVESLKNHKETLEKKNKHTEEYLSEQYEELKEKFKKKYKEYEEKYKKKYEKLESKFQKLRATAIIVSATLVLFGFFGRFLALDILSLDVLKDDIQELKSDVEALEEARS